MIDIETKKVPTYPEVRELNLVAAPGAGKQTNTDILTVSANRLRGHKVAVCETGKELRRLKQRDPELAHLFHKVKDSSFKKMEAGELMPTDEILDLVDVIKSNGQFGNAHKIVNDGFPRTLEQAQRQQERSSEKIVTVNLDLTDCEAEFRLDRRTATEMRTLLVAGGINIDQIIADHDHPYLKGVIADFFEDAKRAQVLSRPMDSHPSLSPRRVEVYRRETYPIVDFAAKQGTLVIVNAMRDIPNVAADVMQVAGYPEYRTYMMLGQLDKKHNVIVPPEKKS